MKALLLTIGAPGSFALRGLALVKLWAWFVAPQFGVAPLRIPVALGIATIFGMLTQQSGSAKEKEDGDQWLFSMLYSFVSSLIALGFGAILRLFV